MSRRPAVPMAGFEVFIGIWNTTGAVRATPKNPAGTLVATDAYRWMPGHHFIVHEVDARFDGEPTRSMEIVGFDAVKRRHVATSYDDQGTTETFVVSLAGRDWTIQGKTVRFEGRFDTRRNRLGGLWETRLASRWLPWIDLELRRA